MRSMTSSAFSLRDKSSWKQNWIVYLATFNFPLALRRLVPLYLSQKRKKKKKDAILFCFLQWIGTQLSFEEEVNNGGGTSQQRPRKGRKLVCFIQGGLAARSGTEFTWFPQLRNLAEWDWVPIFHQNKYGGECGHWKMMSFCSVLRFTASKHQEKVFMNFSHEIFGYQEAWCMNSSWVTSLIMIRHLGKFSYL